ncbi:MAG: hypothetical protein HFACDABA_00106 [Anaerolineales bacterium]|nr:hypothetical protein [Anaerolineales bacterium]
MNKRTVRSLITIFVLLALTFGAQGVTPARVDAAPLYAATKDGWWTWVDGSDTTAQPGTYGTEDVPGAANVPGARRVIATWSDASGNLWLFGGYGRDSANTQGLLNDLWKFNPATGEWTWVDGSNVVAQSGTYGTEDVADSANVPGARDFAVSWTDSAGRFWLFGGSGRDSANTNGLLNDLWKFDPATGEWTWVDGSNVIAQSGMYGTEDVAAAANVPGARMKSITWRDASGNLWLFGGYGHDSNGNAGLLNDLWKFDPATGEWTWVDGEIIADQSGNYGTEDVSDPANTPNARAAAASWIDSAGNLWLFGGDAHVADTHSIFNDLWKFNPANGEWTWVDGPKWIGDQKGIYGTEDVAHAANVPGARESAVSWIDSAGKLWLFGGYGVDSVASVDLLNDLWMFDPTTGEWTWVDGSNIVSQNGIYGTEDVPAAANVPGARMISASWIDANNNLWLFGGLGYDGANVLSYYLNDLWMFSGHAPDLTPPIVSVPADMVVPPNVPAGAVVNFSATATDETYPTNPVVTCVPPSGSTFPLGTTTVNCSATDGAGNTGYASFNVTVAESVSATFYSIGGYDGTIFETNENSGVGSVPNVPGATLDVGDHLLDRQSLLLVHFDTSSLPDNAVVTGVTLLLKRSSFLGVNPFTTHGDLQVDIASPFFSPEIFLRPGDFEAAASAANVGIFNPVAQPGNWYEAALDLAAFAHVNLFGSTQLRAHFSLDDNDDLGADLVRFFSGNHFMPSYRPTLIVEYYVP